ncbi:MAG: hypothetical protein C0494_05985 [Sphingobium sp.]|nr:hypothetical protein [Sphingobium sp.]
METIMVMTLAGAIAMAVAAMSNGAPEAGAFQRIGPKVPPAPQRQQIMLSGGSHVIRAAGQYRDDRTAREVKLGTGLTLPISSPSRSASTNLDGRHATR